MEYFAAYLKILHDILFSVEYVIVVVVRDKSVPIQSQAEAELIGFAVQVALTKGEMAVETVPGVGAPIVVVLEEGGVLPAFLCDFLEGAVVAADIQVVGVEGHFVVVTVNGARVVVAVVTDVEFLALLFEKASSKAKNALRSSTPPLAFVIITLISLGSLTLL